MVVLNKIYTRTGDGGTTALGDGVRVAKHHVRVATYGTCDELNATLGVARLYARGDMGEALSRIQNDLFDLGADFCRPEVSSPENDQGAGQGVGQGVGLRMAAAQVARLEREIDAVVARLDPLRSFILPGGSVLAAHLHVSRTVARRAERLATELAQGAPINPQALTYLNRLSDWLFVAARMANNGGKDDVLWVPGGSRLETSGNTPTHNGPHNGSEAMPPD